MILIVQKKKLKKEVKRKTGVLPLSGELEGVCW